VSLKNFKPTLLLAPKESRSTFQGLLESSKNRFSVSKLTVSHTPQLLVLLVENVSNVSNAPLPVLDVLSISFVWADSRPIAVYIHSPLKSNVITDVSILGKALVAIKPLISSPLQSLVPINPAIELCENTICTMNTKTNNLLVRCV
jgi:hypothetical protein